MSNLNLNNSLFSISQALSFAFSQIYKHFGLWILVWITQIVVPVLLLLGGSTLYYSVLGLVTSVNYQAGGFSRALWFGIPFMLFPALFLLVSGWLRLGIMQMALDLHDKSTTTYKRLFSVPGFVLARSIVALLIVSSFVLPSFLLIIPGIIMTTLFIFVFLILVDKHSGIADALARSAHMSWHALGKMLIMWLFLTALDVLSSLVASTVIFWFVKYFSVTLPFSFAPVFPLYFALASFDYRFFCKLFLWWFILSSCRACSLFDVNAHAYLSPVAEQGPRSQRARFKVIQLYRILIAYAFVYLL